MTEITAVSILPVNPWATDDADSFGRSGAPAAGMQRTDARSPGLFRERTAAIVGLQTTKTSRDALALAIMSGLMLRMAVLSNLVSNTAGAVFDTPIAVELARPLGVAPGPLALALLFGVNMGFTTPAADNCNLLVHGAGVPLPVIWLKRRSRAPVAVSMP